MARLNKVILTGHMTADPELKQTQSGVSVITFNIGVTRKRVKADVEPGSDFFTIVAWRSTADFVARYFRKGNAITVVGELQNRSWEDQNGNKRYVTEIVADEVEFVERREANNTAESTPDYAGTTASVPEFANQPYTRPNFEEIKSDDDLPF